MQACLNRDCVYGILPKNLGLVLESCIQGRPREVEALHQVRRINRSVLTSYSDSGYSDSGSDTRMTRERQPPGQLTDLHDWRFAPVGDLAVARVDWRTAGAALQVAVSVLPTMRSVESRECEMEQ
jgi:hypothetical protein